MEQFSLFLPAELISLLESLSLQGPQIVRYVTDGGYGLFFLRNQTWNRSDEFLSAHIGFELCVQYMSKLEG